MAFIFIEQTQNILKQKIPVSSRLNEDCYVTHKYFSHRYVIIILLLSTEKWLEYVESVRSAVYGKIPR